MSLWDIAESDLSILFDPDGFGESAILNGTTNIVVQFFDGYESAFGEESGITSSEPLALARSSDVADAQQGNTLEVRGKTYGISNVEPTEHGMTLLRLSR